MGRQAADRTHQKRRQGSDKHANLGKQGQARKSARESAEARLRDEQRTRPPLPPEEREGVIPLPEPPVRPTRRR